MKEQETKKRIIVQTPKSHKKASRIEQHYTKIVAAFATLSVLLIACIVYFSFTKTTITITAAPETVSNSFDIPLSDVSGKVFLTDAEGTATSAQFSSTSTKPAKATGQVTLYNTYSQNQPLRSTTRLLSTEGILFRTIDSVTVPARSSITVDVIADQEGAEGNIGASTFEIVALSQELKSKIYGQSTAAMTGGVVTSTTIAQSDIDALTNEAETQFLEKARTAFMEEMADREDLPENVDYSSVIIHNTPTTTPSASAGTTAESLTVSIVGTAAIAAFDKTLLISALSEKISAAIPAGYALQNSLNPDDVMATLVLRSEDGSDAQLRVAIDYTTILSATHEKLRTAQLTNMTESRIKSYIHSVVDASDITVQFSPFWLKMTPSLEDHITIKVQ